MVARPLDVIFDELVRNTGRGATLRRKFVANKDRAWFLAIVLHSFAKHAEGTKLTDLEQAIVSAFRKNGYTDERINAHGKLDRELPRALRDEMFPHRFAQLDVKQNYTLADLKRDVPEIVKSVHADLSVTMSDGRVLRPGSGQRPGSDVGPGSDQRPGAGQRSGAERPGSPSAAAASGRFTIKASKFTCVHRLGDSVADPKNEPYFVFGSLGSSGTAVTTRSAVFDDVDGGSTRAFSAADGCLWGQNRTAQALPDGEVASLIALFEHDSGDIERIRAGVASAFAAAAGVLGATVVAAWVAAVVAGVGVMIQWLIGFMEDDHVGDNVLVFTSQDVKKQLPTAGKSYDVVRRFTDGKGDYRLTVRVARTS